MGRFKGTFQDKFYGKFNGKFYFKSMWKTYSVARPLLAAWLDVAAVLRRVKDLECVRLVN